MIRVLGAFAISIACSVPCAAEDGELTREQKVRLDKQRVESKGGWLYNDFTGAVEQAKESGKPILVVLRCLPCEECVKLDDELVDNDPVIKKLLEEYVCVRIVGTNGLDLDIFQYDTDQSFAVFMLTADGTVLGRFGTRSHRTEWLGDVSLEGMAQALEGGLELFRGYPENREKLAGKRGAPLEFGSPEQFPKLKKKYTDTLNYKGDVVASCIHCHQIGEARREFYWQRGKPIPEKLLFSYPHPKSLGLILDPNHSARVKDIAGDSPASASGLQVGDDILSMGGQPLLSMADVQWVLHNTSPDGGEIPLRIERQGKEADLTLKLDEGWRRSDNISWRVTSWTLCRMMLGGMRLAELDQQEREKVGVGDGQMALRVKNAGKYGPHGLARRNGFLPDDIIVAYDGQRELQTETEVFAYANEHLRPGSKVTIELIRNGQKLSKQLPIQR